MSAGQSASAPPIHGQCDPAFAAVEAAFRENFAERDEIGAAVAIRIDGREVVDLWGGHRDAARRRPWARDTLVNTYSVAKGVTAMLVLSLIERGELDLDRPIIDVWPELGVEGKAETTLRMLLAHRGGLPGVRRTLAGDAIHSWATMTGALAAQAPFWPPGTEHGYHVNSFGFLVGEPVVRRLGLRFADALRRHLTGPRGADFHIGLPRSEHGRVAEVVLPDLPYAAEGGDAMMRHLGTGDPGTDELLRATYANPPGLSGFGTVNTAEWRLASIPSTNGHGTARAVALLYDAFLGRRDEADAIVGPGLLREAIRAQSDGLDRVLRKPSRFGLGFQLSQPSRRVGSASGFGHYGYGGTLGFADPETGVAFGYLMNRPGTRWSTPRTDALLDALDEALGRPAWQRAEEAGEDRPER